MLAEPWVVISYISFGSDGTRQTLTGPSENSGAAGANRGTADEQACPLMKSRGLAPTIRWLAGAGGSAPRGVRRQLNTEASNVTCLPYNASSSILFSCFACTCYLVSKNSLCICRGTDMCADCAAQAQGLGQ